MCREKLSLIYHDHIQILGLILVKLYVKSFHTPIILKSIMFLISNFRRVLNVVCFLLGNSPASEFYRPTFLNILSVASS